MRMSLPDTKIFPKFTYFVKKNLIEAAKVPEIVKAMQKYGKIEPQTFRWVLTWGQGPMIKIIPIPGACGRFTNYTRSNVIEIDVALVREFERGEDDTYSYNDKPLYKVGTTLLHELVHWGDDQTGTDTAGEEGEAFEEAVYKGYSRCWKSEKDKYIYMDHMGGGPY